MRDNLGKAAITRASWRAAFWAVDEAARIYLWMSNYTPNKETSRWYEYRTLSGFNIRRPSPLGSSRQDIQTRERGVEMMGEGARRNGD